MTHCCPTFVLFCRIDFSQVIVSSSLILLQALCGSDACKLSVSNWSIHSISGPQLIVDLFEGHIKSPVVTKYISGVIAALTLRQPNIAKSFVTSGASNYLIKLSWIKFEK